MRFDGLFSYKVKISLVLMVNAKSYQKTPTLSKKFLSSLNFFHEKLLNCSRVPSVWDSSLCFNRKKLLLNIGIDPNLISKKKFVFFFFSFIQREISLSGENIFSLATFSPTIYHIRSNWRIRADNQHWVNQSEYAKCIIGGWDLIM